GNSAGSAAPNIHSVQDGPSNFSPCPPHPPEQYRHPPEIPPHQAAPCHPPQPKAQAQGQVVAQPHVQAQGHLVAQ
ncbi:hypothetical protein A2U01_0098346, partial [Trifolium medium]|nr:hypothetical protein [Trifolium medium]